MMKLKFIPLMLFFTSPFSQAAIQCSPELLTTPDSYPSALNTCRTESKLQGRDFLNSWITEKENNCRILYPQSFSAPYKNCIDEVMVFSNKILTCSTDIHRHQEAVSYDQQLLTDMIQESGASITIPNEVQESFRRLVKITEENFKFRFPIHWSLRAYQGKVPNAHAGAGGDIVLSDSFWTGQVRFSTGEISAIMSHEIAHVLKEHSLKLGCLALEWVESDMGIAEATRTFREDFNSNSIRGIAWSSQSQNYEFEADKVATLILKAAGMDPRLMAEALTKLKPKDTGGFSSGSHPTFDVRIKNALEGL